MAIARLKNWIAETLFASDLNSEFNNILTNAADLISPFTKNIAAGSFKITGLGAASAAGDAVRWEQLGLILLGTTTTTNGATHDVTSGITSTHDEYELHVVGLTPATNAQTLWLRVSEDAGVNFKAGASDYAWESNATAGGINTPSNDIADSEIELAPLLNSGATVPFYGVIRFWQPAGTTKTKAFMYDFAYSGSSSHVRQIGYGTYLLTTNAINALRLLMASGNITVTTYLYAVKKA